MESFRRYFLFLSLIMCCGLAWCQSSVTSLRGVITDPVGALIPGAVVTIENKATGFKATQTANGSGEYQFQQIAPGTYVITAGGGGFGSQSKQADLLVDQPATVNFKLSVDTVATTVDVSAEAQTLNVTDATLGNALNNQLIQALPSEGRNVPDLLSLQPGVLYLGRGIDKGSDSRTGSVAGARSDQTNVTLDGLDDNDQEAGFAFTGVLRSTLDSVEEFRVTTTGSNADAGRSSGGQVSMVTKSGTNQFHGSLYEYNRTGFGYANDWFNKQAQLAGGLPNRPGKLIRNTFGASTGGPVKKDKLFFFANYEGQRTAENKQITRITPTASFKAGNLSYLSNNQVVTLTPAQIASMDPNCFANATCPWGAGVDPNVLNYFSLYPTANGVAAGDGLNLGSYTFSSPYPGRLNTSIANLTWTPTQNHRIFVRGNYQKDYQADVVQYPGLPPNDTTEDNSKGIAAGDTWSISPNLVNDFRYGYIRQGYGNRGIGSGEYVIFRFMDQATSQNRSTLINVPVNNFIDTVSWTKSKHTLSAGINWRIVHNNRNSDESSYSSGNTNIDWINTGGGIAGLGTSLDPGAFGFPAVDNGFSNSYDQAVGLITGLVPEVIGQYNYAISKDGTTGASLAPGAFIDRHFKANEFEYFLQDSWRALPNLTLTFGIRHTILQTPYETSGQQLAPTVNADDWFHQRASNAANGVAFETPLTFAPSGQARGLKPYWPAQHGNIAPRFAFAFAPNPKTSVRGGFGLYFDHFGQGIVNSFDQLGSYGLTTSIGNPAGSFTVDNSPRFTGLQNLPPNSCAPPGTLQYPYTPPTDPNCGLAITWGIDDKIKTPYSETFNFSVQRQLPGGFLLEGSYVGRLGRHLMQQLDLAEPVNLVDPKGGGSYFYAATQLSKLVDANGGNPNATVPAIPYFEDLFPDAAGTDAGGDGAIGNSATQNIYTDVWAQNRGNETTALLNMDVFCYPGCGGTPYRYYQSQFSSLYAWDSIGVSSYNAGQVTLRHEMSHGLQMDFSYTYASSFDYGSDVERTGELNSGVLNSGSSFSEIVNSFNPALNRGPSDFDTRHLISGDWVYLLPFGNGQMFAGDANKLVDGLIGGWQLSGLGRWSSGLPFSVGAPEWSTNYQQQSNMVRTGPVKIRKHILNGVPEVFDDPVGINNGVANGFPLRQAYPGEAGERNNYRGDGFFSIDSGLTKAWSITESQSVKFAWEVFNVTNSARFDTSPQNPNGGLVNTATNGTLGVYSSTLTAPRVMQFSLRYSF